MGAYKRKFTENVYHRTKITHEWKYTMCLMIFKNHTDQTYQLLAEFKRSPAPVDKSLKNKKIFQKEEKFNKTS